MEHVGPGMKLLAMIFLGFLLIEVGLTGRLGSILGAMTVPEYMIPEPTAQHTGLT